MVIRTRKQIRLKRWDYSDSGWYFITICTQGRKKIFGDIRDNRIIFNSHGNIISNVWLNIQNKFNNVEIDEFQIMPNHIHGIIVIRNTKPFVGAKFISPETFPISVIEKKRDQNIAHKATPLALYGDVKDKIALIVDDMVVSGSTMIPAVELCLNRGTKTVYACAVHHDFTSSAPEKLQNSKLEKFFTTNTIALKKEQTFSRLIEFSISSLISEELK